MDHIERLPSVLPLLVHRWRVRRLAPLSCPASRCWIAHELSTACRVLHRRSLDSVQALNSRSVLRDKNAALPHLRHLAARGVAEAHYILGVNSVREGNFKQAL